MPKSESSKMGKHRYRNTRIPDIFVESVYVKNQMPNFTPKTIAFVIFIEWCCFKAKKNDTVHYYYCLMSEINCDHDSILLPF